MSSLQNHSTEETFYRLSAGETRDIVRFNEPTTDWHIVQEAGSCLRLHIFYFPSSVCRFLHSERDVAPLRRTRIVVEQQGEGCKTEIYGLAWLQGNEQGVIETRVCHQVGGGESTQLVKFVLDDASRGEFYGELQIAPGAQHTEAHQTNRNLLLSRDATMRTRPQLEIYADDVKATHGAGTGQLDEMALFYMRQRCIDEHAARQLLISAFMKDVVETVFDTKWKARLMQAIDSVIE